MKIEKQFRELLKKYKKGSISRHELDAFVQLYSKHDELDKILSEDIQSDWMSEERSAGKPGRRGRRIPMKIWRNVAVAASFLLLISLGLYLLFPAASSPLLYTTAYGEQKEVELPDGSIILMNANTQLEWDTDWQRNQERRVKIEGEAFFDVAHLEKNTRFIVETDQLNVHVTGTTFNVRDRKGAVDVFLNSGKIHLELNEGGRESIPMDPGQAAAVSDESEEVVISESRTLTQSASWVEGRFEFENEYLPEILEDFEALYGVSFDIQNEALLEKRMDLSLPYAADWELLRQALEIALSVELIENQQQIIVK